MSNVGAYLRNVLLKTRYDVCMTISELFLIPVGNNDGTMWLFNCIHKDCADNEDKFIIHKRIYFSE